MGHDAGFSTAGTGKHEERSFDEPHCLLLRFIQAFEKMGRDFVFHGGILYHSGVLVIAFCQNTERSADC